MYVLLGNAVRNKYTLEIAAIELKEFEEQHAKVLIGVDVTVLDTRMQLQKTDHKTDDTVATQSARIDFMQTALHEKGFDDHDQGAGSV